MDQMIQVADALLAHSDDTHAIGAVFLVCFPTSLRGQRWAILPRPATIALPRKNLGVPFRSSGPDPLLALYIYR